MEILTSAEAIFDNGNKHMTTKFRYIGKAEQEVVKYIIAKLRKYHGSFFEKYKAIAEEVGCSTKTVQRAVDHAITMLIFKVTPRFERTLSGKNRKTTNLIQLLPYAPFTIVSEYTCEAREVKKPFIKLVDVAEKKMEAKKAQAPKKQYNKQNTKPVHTELLPDWFEEEAKKRAELDAQKPVEDKDQQRAEINAMFASMGINNKF
jgi:DNA replication protein DnaD